MKQNHTLNEVLGLILLGVGTLLFLALVSYTPRDLPDWFPLSYITPPNDPPQNFIGPAGAIVASVFYFFLGAASYLVAGLLLGFGGYKLVWPDHSLSHRGLWIGLFLLSGASLLHLQDSFLTSWPETMNVKGAGGWLGYVIGGKLFASLLARPGAFIVLFCLYVCSLIKMTGSGPIALARRALALPPLLLARYRKYRLGRANEQERLGIEQKRLARETKKLEKQINKQKKGAPAPAAEEPLEPSFEDDLLGRPTPQVIDTSLPAPKRTGADAQPALEVPTFENYTLPPVDLLDETDPGDLTAADPDELRGIQNTLIETLQQFNIPVAAGDITRGPTITRYEVYPSKGIRVDKILSLERDLARATRAERINILAPIPGKDTVGIEIANSRKAKVALRELLESDDWVQTKAKIPLALGKDVYGRTIIADLAQMPHLLVAGTPGSGKSVCINSMLASICYRFSPEDLRFIMIDPKVVEMQVYNALPHLAIPVVTDPKKVLLALRWVIDEMEKRYKIFASVGVRNVTGFNARPKPKSQAELDEEADAREAAGNADPAAELLPEEPAPPPIRVRRDDEPIAPERMPYIVVIIDELADLMQTAPADVESAIARITQMARAAGIHMIVATQTPRADVVTGVIKANIPSRVAFQVASGIDSRIILDEKGAERLLGQGDMLYLPPGTSRLTRAQGVFVDDAEIERIVAFAARQTEPAFDVSIQERLESNGSTEEEVSDEDEELVQKCIEIMRQEGKASTSMFQRRLRLGYTRAARVVDILEQRGLVAPGEGAKPREILMDLDTMA